MPALTQAQWDAIRRVAAEAARKFIQKNYTPPSQELLDLGFHPSQIVEITKVASAAASKTMKQMESAAQFDAEQKAQTQDLLPVWNFKCAATFMDPRPDRTTTPGAKDGDRYWQGTELFTFFRGEWRRRSELEGYASAAKYL